MCRTCRAPTTIWRRTSGLSVIWNGAQPDARWPRRPWSCAQRCGWWPSWPPVTSRSPPTTCAHATWRFGRRCASASLSATSCGAVRLRSMGEQGRHLGALLGAQLGLRSRRGMAPQRLDARLPCPLQPLADRACGHPECGGDLLLFPALLLQLPGASPPSLAPVELGGLRLHSASIAPFYASTQTSVSSHQWGAAPYLGPHCCLPRHPSRVSSCRRTSSARCRPRQARRDPSTGRRLVKAKPLAGCRALRSAGTPLPSRQP